MRRAIFLAIFVAAALAAGADASAHGPSGGNFPLPPAPGYPGGFPGGFPGYGPFFRPPEIVLHGGIPADMIFGPSQRAQGPVAAPRPEAPVSAPASRSFPFAIRSARPLFTPTLGPAPGPRRSVSGPQ
ncbi:exported protein of unknown function [Rhodovastum atsumiense]|nr:exported protein of unknown function [Rhodovastum atsumiense]